MNEFDWNAIEASISEPQPFYAQVMLTVVHHAPLLAQERLARRVMASLAGTRDRAPGALWAYTVLPDSVRLIAGPAETAPLDAYVEALKAASAARVLEYIRRADDDTLDVVLHYNPVWGGPIYRVWEAGYHLTVFSSEYRLSNAIYSLRQQPVEAALVSEAGDWPYTWVGGEA